MPAESQRNAPIICGKNDRIRWGEGPSERVGPRKLVFVHFSYGRVLPDPRQKFRLGLAPGTRQRLADRADQFQRDLPAPPAGVPGHWGAVTGGVAPWSLNPRLISRTPPAFTAAAGGDKLSPLRRALISGTTLAFTGGWLILGAGLAPTSEDWHFHFGGHCVSIWES